MVSADEPLTVTTFLPAVSQEKAEKVFESLREEELAAANRELTRIGDGLRAAHPQQAANYVGSTLSGDDLAAVRVISGDTVCDGRHGERYSSRF